MALEECSLKKETEERPIHAEICTSSVSVMTDMGNVGTENKTVVSSGVHKSVMCLCSGEIKSKYVNIEGKHGKIKMFK